MDDGRYPIITDVDGTHTSSRLHKVDRVSIAFFQMGIDGIVLVTLSYISVILTTLLTTHDPQYVEFRNYLIPTFGVTLAAVFSFGRSGIYNPINEVGVLRVLLLTAKHLINVIFMLVALLFIFKVSDSFSRLWLGIWTVSSAVGLCCFRLIVAGVAGRLIRAGRLTKNVAVVGANQVGQKLATILAQGNLGTHLAGLFDERQSRIVRADHRTPRVRHLAELEELLRDGHVDEVVIAISPSASGRIFDLMRRFHPYPVSLRVLSPAGFENFQVLDNHRYGGVGTFCVMGRPLDEAAIVIKRLEDIVIALTCLLITLPVFAIIAVCIKLDSRGPVFFRQKRVGSNNLPFDLRKFRSMHVDQSDPLGQRLTEADDPRVTRVGKFIRRTSIDELPQLINVLRGEMSLVGPRPHPLAASAAGIAYARAIQEYPIRHRVKPGITGWAQVNGWRGETVTIEQIRQRVEYDLYYIENWSLGFDFLILGWTVFTVLSRENAV